MFRDVGRVYSKLPCSAEIDVDKKFGSISKERFTN
jgi:hypothetical protein